MKPYYLLFILLSKMAFGQHFHGKVVTDDQIPFEGANVYWENTSIGVITDDNGDFHIKPSEDSKMLIISAVGFETLKINTLVDKRDLYIIIADTQLDEVTVSQRKATAKKSLFTTKNVTVIDSSELLKAACCNLSESFETNPSIDTNFNNAITGVKTIQMLGLSSPYLQITEENIPSVRGAAQVYGLSFTPGPWIESIQLTKGTGSVINGYESVTGAVNTELIKPINGKPWYINLYSNANGRYEANLITNHKVSDRWHTGLLLSANKRDLLNDHNQDGFTDAPIGNQINVLNRWQYTDAKKGWVSFISLRGLSDRKQMGEINAFNGNDSNAWSSFVHTDRVDFSNKTGYVFPDFPYKSFGFQTAYSYHKQDSSYGNRNYNITHNSFYWNGLYQSILGDTRTKFKTGLNLTMDQYDELVENDSFQRTDKNIGAFFELAYDNMDKFNGTLGIRIDHHNNLGTFITPRIHLRYTPWELTSVKGSIGLGRRSASIFAENQLYLASSRTLNLIDNQGAIYGLQGEKALNYGMNILQKYHIGNLQGSLSFDYYITDFKNQVVVDWENPRALSIYNLDGKSFSKSLQFEWNQELSKSIELRSAYKFYDVQTDYSSGRKIVPYQAKHRFLSTLSYQSEETATGRQWRFDGTLTGVGKQRIPSTLVNPKAYQKPAYSDPFTQLNLQLTRVFLPGLELYGGVENLTNYKIPNAIIGADDPFGTYFDTTMVYGPLMGRQMYVGVRLN